MTDVLIPDDTHLDDEEPPEPRRRRGRRTVAVVLAGAVVAAGAVGLTLGFHGGSHAAKTAAPTPPVAHPKTTTTFVQPIRTPTDAAEELYFAWQRGDRKEAARAADGTAIRSIFSIKTTKAAGLAFQGCSKPQTATSSCTWKRTNAELTMHVNVPANGAPQVQVVAMQ